MTPRRTAISFRPAGAADATFVLRLEEAGMREHAVALWGGWRPSATPGALDLTGHRIVFAAGQDVGVVATERPGAHVRLRKLYIAPDARNLGYGAQALGRVVREAASLGVGVRLSVLTTNPAVRFYLREGFEIVEQGPERIWMER